MDEETDAPIAKPPRLPGFQGEVSNTVSTYTPVSIGNWVVGLIASPLLKPSSFTQGRLVSGLVSAQTKRIAPFTQGHPGWRRCDRAQNQDSLATTGPSRARI